jgi:hypothetical protein
MLLSTCMTVNVCQRYLYMYSWYMYFFLIIFFIKIGSMLPFFFFVFWRLTNVLITYIVKRCSNYIYMYMYLVKRCVCLTLYIFSILNYPKIINIERHKNNIDFGTNNKWRVSLVFENVKNNCSKVFK